MHQSCKSILPKFLWKYIIDYLTVDDICKITCIDACYNLIIDDIIWKRCFLNRHPIAIVRCASNVMSNFWNYAFHRCYPCVNLDEALTKIENDIKLTINNNELIYYRVFFRQGKYDCSNTKYDFIHAMCSIELIGCKTALTEINFDHLTFLIPYYFSLTNITFDRYACTFDSRVDKYVSEVRIYNCIFLGLIVLQLFAINVVIIDHCVIKTGNDIGILIKQYPSKYRYLVTHNKIKYNVPRINYTFSHNKFTNNGNCIHVHNNTYDSIHIPILFKHNIVTNARNCFYNYNCYFFIKARSNIFDRVDRLIENYAYNYVTSSIGNKLINCGPTLTENLIK